jgi:hypothetical protein
VNALKKTWNDAAWSQARGGRRLVLGGRRAARVVAVALALVLASCGDDPETTGTSGDELASVATTAASASVAATAALPPTAGTITLITGDRVTVHVSAGKPVTAVEPGPGRKGIAFSIVEHRGEVTVLPRDMAALVAGGRIDRALFEVSKLLADGHGDDKRGDLPLVVTGSPDVTVLGRQLARGAAGITVERTLPALRMLAVRQDKASGGAVLASLTGTGGRAGPGATTAKIWLDRRLKPLLDRSVAQVGGPAAHARGFTGAGVTVAILDGGVDATHPDLADRVALAESFVDDGLGPSDVDGHGTHVASTIAGTGAASGGQFRGVAPGATLISARVCERFGCPISSILAGMEWAVVEHGARIVNVSLGGFDEPGEDPMEAAIAQLSAEHGALFVVAAGNNGFRETITSPGSADAALTVAAVDRDDRLAFFSSQGPRVGDHALKPDIAAPGVDIVAAKAAAAVIGDPVGESYLRLSGTSMATPHVAGAAAILLQQHPDWTGAQIKAALMAAANPNPALGAFAQGAGRLDLDRATQQTVLAVPASLSLDLSTRPHEDDPVQTRTVRYHNTGAAPVELSIIATLNRPDGQPVPAGAIAVAPAALSVPVGGSAEIAVTVDTSFAGPDGLYSGAVTATGRGVRVVTPLGVEREVDRDLTIRVLDRDGQPAFAILFMAGVPSDTDEAKDVLIFGFEMTGNATFRLPTGRYLVQVLVLSGADTVDLIAPRFELSRDSELVMDSRLARPFDVDVAGRDLELRHLSWTFTDDQTLFSLSLVSEVNTFAGMIGPAAPPGEVSSFAFAALAPPGEASPATVYHLAREQRDRFFTGWKQTLRSRDFATVHARHAGRKGDHYIKSVLADGDTSFSGSLASFPFNAPFERTEHYHGTDINWNLSLDQLLDPASSDSTIAGAGGRRRYPEGRSFTESWNQAPFGPVFREPPTGTALPPSFLDAPQRQGDELLVVPSMFSDQTSPARIAGSVVEDQHARLLFNGKVIEETTHPSRWEFVAFVPPEAGQYRLEQEVIRSPELFDLSTRVAAAWTFRSQHVDGPAEILPLPTLRFQPALDEQNQTDARTLVLPVLIARPPGVQAPRLARVSVDASFDDGATWSKVPLVVVGDRAFGLVTHRRGATHVSLRGEAADVEGNAVEQTIIRAYRLAR